MSRRPRPLTLRSVCNDSTDETMSLRLACYAALNHIRKSSEKNTVFSRATMTILRRALRREGGAR